MKFLICLVASIIVIESAPTHLKEGHVDKPVPHLHRVHKTKRSNAAFAYQTPCEAARASAAAASSSVPVIAPPMGYHFLPDERYAYPYAYELPYYREDQDPETLQFSDMDQMRTRNIPTHYYPTAGGYQPHHQYAGMPSLAVFPGTDGRKGCGSVPLLFSCSPSIVQGHLGHAHPYYNYEEQVHAHPEYHYALEEPMWYRQAAPVEDHNMNHAAHHLSLNPNLLAMNQQALQQQAIQKQAEHEHLMNQQATHQDKNEQPSENTREQEPQQEIPLRT